MAGKRGAPMGNKNAKGGGKHHSMTGARVGGIAGALGVRKLTPEAVAFGKSLQKKTGAKNNAFTQAAFNAHMNRKKK